MNELLITVFHPVDVKKDGCVATGGSFKNGKVQPLMGQAFHCDDSRLQILACDHQ